MSRDSQVAFTGCGCKTIFGSEQKKKNKTTKLKLLSVTKTGTPHTRAVLFVRAETSRSSDEFPSERETVISYHQDENTSLLLHFTFAILDLFQHLFAKQPCQVTRNTETDRAVEKVNSGIYRLTHSSIICYLHCKHGKYKLKALFDRQ